MEEVSAGLIKGRHDMPVSRYIFDGPVDPFDFAGMYETAEDFLRKEVGIEIMPGRGIDSAEYTDYDVYQGNKRLCLYVTGLTAAVAAVIEACARNGVGLTLLHYNRDTRMYSPQRIF